MLFQLLFEHVYFLEGLFDLLVVGITRDGVSQEETIEKTMRFDQTIEIHELPARTFTVAISSYLNMRE